MAGWSLCLAPAGSVWETQLPTGFGAFTPCLLSLVLTISYTLLLGVALWRLRGLCNSVKRIGLRASSLPPHLLLLLLAALCVVQPLLQLALGLSAADPEGGYPSGAEALALAMAAAGNAAVLAVLVAETRRASPQLAWHLRFALLWCVVAQATRMQYFWPLRSFFHVRVVAMAVAGAVGELVLALGLVSHFPAFEEVSGPYEKLSQEEEGTEGGIGAGGGDAGKYEEVAGGARGNFPERGVNVLSWMFFSWMSPLMKLGYQRPIEERDVWKLDEWDHSENLHSNFQSCWEEELRRPRPWLLRALARILGARFLLGSFCKICYDASQFVGPVFLGLLLKSMQDREPASKGYLYAWCIFLGTMVGLLSMAQYNQHMQRVGFRTRSTMVAAVFRKSLRLTHHGRRGFTTGKINNLLTTDAETLQAACELLNGLWSNPIRILGSLCLLYQQLGVSSLAGSLLLLLLFPLQTIVIRRAQQYTREGLQCSDRRIGLMSELLAGMDIVKCYVWEESFKGKVGEVRTMEIGWFRKAQVLGAFNTFLLNSIPILVAVVSFGLYVLLGGNLTAARAFTSLALFSILRFPLYMLPTVITQVVNANVSLKRLQDMLLAEEHALEANPALVQDLPAVCIRNGSFSWDPEAERSTLVGVDLEVPVGSFVAVVGGTGEGKTSILSAILGEIPAVGDSGELVLRGEVAYVPQGSWIFNATLRDNVLFGAAFDSVRYNRAIRVSALEQDLELFPAGDLTEIGERGVNISGGQKQRVSIARAVYADADVYLFDDPLSALDAHVAQEVFERCMKEELKGKTIVFATNQLHFLAHVDKIFLVRQGVVEEQGTFEELLAKGPLFKVLMENAGSVEDKDNVIADGEAIPGDNGAGGARLIRNGGSLGKPQGSFNKEHHLKDAESRLTSIEERKKGVISSDVFRRYYAAMGGIWVVAVVFGLYVATEVTRLTTSTWLSIWTDETKSTTHAPNFYNSVYALLSLLQVLITLSSTFCLVFSSLAAAQRLHNGMLGAILRAPMSFFHSNPLGRIINRFAKDTGDIDRNIQTFLSLFLAFLFQLLSTFILIGFVSSLSLWAIMPLLTAFYMTYVYFQTTAREVKRLDSISRSPVYAQFSEALNGLATIRAFRAHGRMAQINAAAMDNSVRFTLLNMSASRWLDIRLQSLGALMMFITATLAVVGNARAVDQAALASQVGLLLTYALNISTLMTLVLRLASTAENSFNAVERVGAYIDIPPEAPPVMEESRPEPSWPEAGAIQFNEVVMRYRPHLPPVLYEVSFAVRPHEKIGIVGRTGAGKSSLMNALFRIVEIERGQIVIDGIDTSKIGLADLRKNLGIIPQFPVPFSGTVRFNLDPFSQHRDVDLWEALERAHLKEAVQCNSSGLEMEVSERGENFSVGQRQLLSLARALLRKSKILVLDEATAAVDVATDVLIQKTIRDEFKSCTMLTIAHRLNTVIDSDRILVIDSGHLVEFDTPHNLLVNEKSKFASMVRSTGAANARYLQQLLL